MALAPALDTSERRSCRLPATQGESVSYPVCSAAAACSFAAPRMPRRPIRRASVACDCSLFFVGLRTFRVARRGWSRENETSFGRGSRGSVSMGHAPEIDAGLPKQLQDQFDHGAAVFSEVSVLITSARTSLMSGGHPSLRASRSAHVPSLLSLKGPYLSRSERASQVFVYLSLHDELGSSLPRLQMQMANGCSISL